VGVDLGGGTLNEQGRKLLEVVVWVQLHFYTCMENQKIERVKEITDTSEYLRSWEKIKIL